MLVEAVCGSVSVVLVCVGKLLKLFLHLMKDAELISSRVWLAPYSQHPDALILKTHSPFGFSQFDEICQY